MVIIILMRKSISVFRYSAEKQGWKCICVRVRLYYLLALQLGSWGCRCSYNFQCCTLATWFPCIFMLNNFPFLSPYTCSCSNTIQVTIVDAIITVNVAMWVEEVWVEGMRKTKTFCSIWGSPWSSLNKPRFFYNVTASLLTAMRTGRACLFSTKKAKFCFSAKDYNVVNLYSALQQMHTWCGNMQALPLMHCCINTVWCIIYVIVLM